MKVALVQCPEYSIRLPHLGLAYLVAALKKAGHEVRVFDFNVDLYPVYPKMWDELNLPRWLASDFFMERKEFDSWSEKFSNNIADYNPDVVGFSLQCSSVVFTLSVAKKVKEIRKDVFIVLGGPECLRESPEFLLKDSSIDCLIQGDADEALVDLIKIYESKGSLATCPGVIFRQNDKIVRAAQRKLINMDRLPVPDFTLFDRSKYLFKDMLPMLTSKGCINKCAFCVDTWYQDKFISRNPESVVNEMSTIMQEYGISVIEFNDLLLNGDLNNLEKMADLIIHKGLHNVSWHGNFVVRKMSKQLIRKLRQAGLRGATFGLESASPRLLKLMNKNVDLATACSVIKEFAKAGVVVNVNWIIGFPGEKRQDLVETAKFLFRHRKYILELSSVAILAINSPSILSKNTEQLKINMGLNALDWSLEDNDLGERIHRRDAFLRFAQGIYKLHPKSGLSSYFSARKLLKTFIRELYS